MTHIWSPALTTEQISQRFKTLITDLTISKEFGTLTADLKQLNCNHYMHEFVRRLILIVIEKNSTEKTKEY